MPVTSEHTQYKENKHKWELVTDCVDGSDAIKHRRSVSHHSGSTSMWGERGTMYLPPPNPHDTSDDNHSRFHSYLMRAAFINFTGFTQEALLGMIFRKPPVFDLPQSIDYLIDDATGSGLTLTQLSQSIASSLIDTGRHGLFADYPSTDSNLSIAQVRAQNLQAHIINYDAKDIINWRVSNINGVNMLTLVVLRDPIELVDDDGFGSETVNAFRVLRLTDGVYTQQLIDEDDDPITEEFTPTQFNGSTWDFIPFQFVGSIENDSSVDKSPIYDIAEINISHYRNSADFEEASFIVGQPTTVISGLVQSWINDNFADGVEVGSRRGLLLPEGGDAKLMQAEANIMPSQGMERKEQQMIMIGARIIQEQKVNETAEGAKIRSSGQNSKLSLIVDNVNASIRQVLEWSLLFMGGEGSDITTEFNDEFFDKSADPQLIMSQIQLVDRGILAKQDIRRNLRQTGLIACERTDEEIDDEASSVDPTI